MTTGPTTEAVQPLNEGRVTIPVAMRRALGITEESLLLVKLEGDRIVMEKLPTESDTNIRIFSDEELAEIFEADKISPELADWARRRFSRSRE